MIKLRGFGGKLNSGDHNLESFTLMAGLAAVTSKLSMIKLRGFGGKLNSGDHNLESFTLMAGLAAVTSK
ncbi:hypothetical protein C9885_29965, partial [Klebsiella pneumoniae]